MRYFHRGLEITREQAATLHEHGVMVDAMIGREEQLELPFEAQSLRTFDSGATRSPLGDKLQYEGYLSPIVIRRFAQYMKKHQTQSDGKQRAADNWQNGIPKESLMDSGYRHFIDWWLHHRGYGQDATEDLQESLCALLFNVMAYLKAELDGEK